MTPAQFEKYRQDTERRMSTMGPAKSTAGGKADDSDEDEINYEDDEDDIEKSKQMAKQRRKQEAHMAVYRQQMMKVTGESANPDMPRPTMQTSLSAPALNGAVANRQSIIGVGADDDDEDEEIPLAILAAHGFPSKNRPPTNRLSSIGTNPNLRASQIAPYPRPSSAMAEPVAGPSHSGGGGGGGPGGRLPPFARNLPKDPYFGAGLVRPSNRESFALGGGAPAPNVVPPQLHPGGLVGVIAQEERSRALRRGSPNLEGQMPLPPNVGHDPLMGVGMAQHTMYPNGGATYGMPGDPGQQMHMNQQMQFMQMQMQFMQMQMMAANQQGQAMGMHNPMATQSTGDLLHNPRHSMIALDMHQQPMPPMGMQPPAGMHGRTLSTPSNGSFMQPPAGYAPSIRIQGVGYAPSIAPSERSNVGLPGRYRPVSQAPQAFDINKRSSTMSGAITGWNEPANRKSPGLSIGAGAPGPAGTAPATTPRSSGNASDDDDEEGWEAMKAKRDKKKSIWRSKKSFGSELSAFIH